MNYDLLNEVAQDMQRQVSQAQLSLVKAAMLQEAPDVEALGFDAYRFMLAMDSEGPNMQMVMLEREPGQPCQPIVLLLTDFSVPSIPANESYRMGTTVTPIAGEAGWEHFQAQRARNNIRD